MTLMKMKRFRSSLKGFNRKREAKVNRSYEVKTSKKKMFRVNRSKER